MKRLTGFYKNTFKWRGRESRRSYWITLGLLLAALLAIMVMGTLVGTTTGTMGLTHWVSVLAVLSSILPLLSMTARRLHDLGWSAWWLIAGAITGGLFTSVLSLFPGQKGTNKYGADPSSSLDEVPAGPAAMTT